MALRSALGLWAYTVPGLTAYPLIVREYGELVEGLELTTVAPGGFGDLACVVKLPDARLPRPELALFSRCVLQDGPATLFSGEWSDPALVLDAHGGEYVVLSALGGGVALRDDPDDSAYTTQTAQAILAAEFSKRSAYLALDNDQKLVLPTAPTTTFSPVYDGYTLEEICHDLAFDLGDYTWGVWDHATHRDAAGFPTWQLQLHQRDVTTTHYTAYAEDILGWRIAPSSQRAYNVVQVAYVDPASGPGTVTVSDSRLNSNGSQGLAPFRRRKLRRGLGKVPMTLAQATTIANAWLTGYKDVTNKVEVELRTLRDAFGMPLPLHLARADHNLYVPELAVRGQGYGKVALAASGPQPGVNQFYIVETSYRETAAGDVRLVLQLDNYADHAASILAQLKLAYDAGSRARGVYRTPISPGVPVVGPCGAAFSNEVAGGTVAVMVPFPGQLAKAPTSVTLTVIAQSNTSSVQATNLTNYGFTLTWTVPSTGATSWRGTYTTVGN
jgi:hypothetical protein